MNEHSGIAETLLEILQLGLLRIRALGWSGDARRCAVEADHIHNVPRLVVDCDSSRLAYYWEVERIAYINQTEPELLAVWEPLWRQLQIHVETAASSTSTP
jgi:hypothetical protein